MDAFRAVFYSSFVSTFRVTSQDTHTVATKWRRFLRCKAIIKQKSNGYGNLFFKFSEAEFSHKNEDFRDFCDTKGDTRSANAL
jgi:hypothetical protein